MATVQHTTWSPSKLTSYEQCPLQAKFKYLDKLPEPPSPILERGSAMHSACEAHVTGRAPASAALLRAPGVAEVLDGYAKQYKKGAVRTELSIGVRSDWSSCDFFADDVWARFKVDLIAVDKKKRHAEIVDWKTGKFKPNGEYDDQLRLYCVAVLCATPEALGGLVVDSASAKLFFLDVGKFVERDNGRLTREELPAELARWEKKVRPMLTDKGHVPHPSPLCSWCAFSVQRGGKCKF